jgi:hypothetical protein
MNSPAGGGSKSFFHLGQKPFVIVHRALNGFHHKDFAGAALVCGRADLVSFASKSGLRGTSIFPGLAGRTDATVHLRRPKLFRPARRIHCSWVS